jgi:hypothetical protein
MRIITLRTVAVAAALTVTAGAAHASIFSVGPDPFPNGSGFDLSAPPPGGICVVPGECTHNIYIQNLQLVSASSIPGGFNEQLTANFYASFSNGATATLSLVPGTYFSADITGGYNPFTNPLGTFPETLLTASFVGVDSLGNAITAFLNPPPATTGLVSITSVDGGFDIVNGFTVYAGSIVNGVPVPVPPLGATNTPAVPEPSTWALMLLGFGGLGFAAYRRNRAALAAD